MKEHRPFFVHLKGIIPIYEGGRRVTIAFEPITLERRDDYLHLYNLTPQKASDYSFINLWAWHNDRKYEWAFEADLCWLRTTSSESIQWAPVGSWHSIDWRNVLSKLFPNGVVFDRVPENLANILQQSLGDDIQLEEEREEWEYIYRVSDLIELSGNRFHKKKNLLQQFIRSYDYSYSPITLASIGHIIELQKEWCEWRNCDDSPGLKAESCAIRRVLEHWGEMPSISGGVLSVKDQMVAYTVAESIDNETIVIHFEKGMTDYKGVYQAINQIFLDQSAHSFEWVNREQDMGSEGIRKAKMSYNPATFLKKYRVTWGA